MNLGLSLGVKVPSSGDIRVHISPVGLLAGGALLRLLTRDEMSPAGRLGPNDLIFATQQSSATLLP